LISARAPKRVLQFFSILIFGIAEDKRRQIEI